MVINAFTLPGLHQIPDTDRTRRDVDTTTDPPSDPCVVLDESAMTEAGASVGAHHSDSHEMHPFTLTDTCTSELFNIVFEQGLNERTLCPWAYNISYDPNR